MIFMRNTFLATLAIFLFACSTTEKTTSDPTDLEGMEHVEMPPIVVTPEAIDAPDETFPYRPARERKWDLLHTALDLSFVWSRESVQGKAKLRMTPLFYAQQTIELDAVDFTIHALALNGKPYSNFSTTPTQLHIKLPRAYAKGEELTLDIEYTATPRPGELEAGEAITNDKGLFFIDPMDTIPGLPRQIWTQGETSSNRRWYPTFDQPNERGTQEITLTVPDSLITLSNGILVSSTPVENGMRKDYWKLDLPHAPYLAMIAVGQWDKVTDYWRGRPVEYYVDPGYGDDARAIFAHTPEMLDYFSTTLDVPYVWPKYSQIIVKNFVTGAMENTTAVIFGDFIQFRKEDVLEDGANDYIVAHEMFHHWFGDLVTCESWANIALNEGFANYAEYLWAEHKYGKEKADIARMSELSGYFDQAEYNAHALIDYHYSDEVSIFDAHSYNKGGLVLHMLRYHLGDNAFFAGLQHYLDKHKFSAVEVHDLRQAFEEVSGQDLNWFFNQWYFGVGHPVISAKHHFDAGSKKLVINLEQTQDSLKYHPVFRLPVSFAIFDQDTVLRTESIWMDQQKQSFTFDMNTAPLAVVMDPNDILLAVVNHQVDSSEYLIRALKVPSISHRMSTLRLIPNMTAAVENKLMRDSSGMMRAMMISYFADKQMDERLYEMALREQKQELQYYILEVLPGLDPIKGKQAAMLFLEKADRIPLIYAGLKTIESQDVNEAAKQLERFKAMDSPGIYTIRASILAKQGSNLSLDYFTTPAAAAVEDQYLEEFIAAMTRYLRTQPADIQVKGLGLIESDFYLKTPNNTYRRFYLLTGVLTQYNEETDEYYKGRLLQTIRNLYKMETDEYLRSVLKEGLGNLVD
jgi:aminopeptidase N